MYTKPILGCFNNGPFLQIRSQILYQKWSLIANQVTYINWFLFLHIDSLIKYATINITSNHIVYLPNEDNSTVWPGTKWNHILTMLNISIVGPPPDGSPIQVKVARTTVLVAIMYLWSSLGIIFSIICLIFNIVFRKRRYMFNHIINYELLWLLIGLFVLLVLISTILLSLVYYYFILQHSFILV